MAMNGKKRRKNNNSLFINVWGSRVKSSRFKVQGSRFKG